MGDTADDTGRNGLRPRMRHRASPPPPRDDATATLAWLRDREVIKDVYSRYAYGVDSLDVDLVRSVFHPECTVIGTMEEGSVADYVAAMMEGLVPYAATMHFKGNQYVEIDGDRAFVETWVLGHHFEAADSPIDSLILVLRYCDELVRVGDGWQIIHREAIRHHHTGPLPRPFIGPPPYPRPAHESRARKDTDGGVLSGGSAPG